MPKYRRRSNRTGAKSQSLHISFKIGGRKSGTSAHRLSNDELERKLTTVRKRDRNKLRRIWELRKRNNDLVDGIEGLDGLVGLD